MNKHCDMVKLQMSQSIKDHYLSVRYFVESDSAYTNFNKDEEKFKIDKYILKNVKKVKTHTRSYTYLYMSVRIYQVN